MTTRRILLAAMLLAGTATVGGAQGRGNAGQPPVQGRGSVAGTEQREALQRLREEHRLALERLREEQRAEIERLFGPGAGRMGAGPAGMRMRDGIPPERGAMGRGDVARPGIRGRGAMMPPGGMGPRGGIRGPGGMAPSRVQTDAASAAAAAGEDAAACSAAERYVNETFDGSLPRGR